MVILRKIQWLVFFFILIRNSSRPEKRIKIAIGVKIPKNIIPITKGLTTLPNKIPTLNHNLFKGKRISALITVTDKKITLRNPKI